MRMLLLVVASATAQTIDQPRFPHVSWPLKKAVRAVGSSPASDTAIILDAKAPGDPASAYVRSDHARDVLQVARPERVPRRRARALRRGAVRRGRCAAGRRCRVGVRARYAVVPHVAAGAQLDVGAAHTSLSLTDAMDHTLSDSGWGGIAEGTLSVELLAVDGPRFRLGLRLELGYAAAAAITLAGRSAHPDDGTLRLPMTRASLGSLDLSGPYAALSAVSAF